MASFIGTQPGTSIVGELSGDTTPQLGGSLDETVKILSVSNGNILYSQRTGVVRIDGTNGIDIESGSIGIKNSGAVSTSDTIVSQVMLIIFSYSRRTQ